MLYKYLLVHHVKDIDIVQLLWKKIFQSKYVKDMKSKKNRYDTRDKNLVICKSEYQPEMFFIVIKVENKSCYSSLNI